jgi:anaerobic selenocysteine-containing dehydrogenase
MPSRWPTPTTKTPTSGGPRSSPTAGRIACSTTRTSSARNRLLAARDELDGKIPNIKAIFWHGSDWFNQLTNINKEIEAIKKLELVVCMDSTITPSGLWADVLLPDRHPLRAP